MIENISFGKDAAYLYAAMNYNFFIKKESDKSGKSPIYLNVRLNGKRARISTLLKIEEKHWDKEKKKVIKCDEADDYNLILKQLENRITNIIVKHRLSETPLTMDMFLNQLKNAPPSYDLVQFFEHVIQDQDLSESTIIKHKGIFNKLKNSKIPSSFPDINLLWFDKYRSYLKKLGNNSATVNTNISIIKKYLRMAKANGIKIYVNLDWVKVGSTGGRIIWLKEEEIKKMEEYYYSSFIPEHLKLSLGYFLFSCYTGLRISDVMERNRDDFNADTFEFISIKTKMRQIIGIGQKCRQIIDNNPMLFIAKKAGVHINKQIKEIAIICGIKKNISFHTARHSCATNYLIKGGKVENLQKLLGHTKIMTTMKYVHIIDEEAALTTNIFD